MSRSRPCKGRWRRILAATRTLRSTCPSPAWDPSSAPGSSANSATTPTATTAAKPRKNYAATSPITRASGKKKVVAARFIRNDRLTDALMAQAFTALSASPGARAPYAADRAPRTPPPPTSALGGGGRAPRAGRAAPRAQPCPAQGRQPARRHLARMPQNPHPLRRGHRLAPPRKQARRLTSKPLGCLSCPQPCRPENNRLSRTPEDLSRTPEN